MDYSFIRKLVKKVSAVNVEKTFQVLTSNGIEVFVKIADEYQNMTVDMISENTDLYVSAADLEQARELMKAVGLGEYLCTEMEENASMAKSEVEKAEEEFYRKHRQNQIFAWVVIAGVVMLMIIQIFK